MPQGDDAPPPGVRAVPPAPPDGPSGLEGVGRRRLPLPHPRAPGPLPVHLPRHRHVRPGELGGGLPVRGRRAPRHRPALQRRGGEAAAPRGGLRARDGGRHGRGRHPDHEVPGRDGAPRGPRQVRDVPVLEPDGAPRPPRPGGAARGGPRRPELVELHLARRPGPRLPLRPRAPGLRRGLQRAPERPAAHPGRQEPGGEQDAREPLLHRAHGAGRQDRRGHPRVQPARHQGRLLDSLPPWPRRYRHLPRHCAHPHGAQPLRRRFRQTVYRSSAPHPHRHPQAARPA